LRKLQETEDREAFSQIVELTLPGLLSFAVRLCGDKDRAEDWVQDGYTALAEGYHSIGKPGSLMSWLKRVVWRKYIGWIGLKGVEVPLPPDEIELLGASMSRRERTGSNEVRETAERNEEFHEVHRALESLPVKMRECLVLRHLRGLPAPAVAKKLGIEVSTVYTYLSKGLRMVRAHWRLNRWR